MPNIVSRRGRRERRQHGHKNFMSVGPGGLLPLYDVLGIGTQFATK